MSMDTFRGVLSVAGVETGLKPEIRSFLDHCLVFIAGFNCCLRIIKGCGYLCQTLLIGCLQIEYVGLHFFSACLMAYRAVLIDRRIYIGALPGMACIFCTVFRNRLFHMAGSAGNAKPIHR